MMATGPTGAEGEKVVPLGPGDLEAVVALERAMFPAPWTREQYAYGLAHGVLALCGITSGGRLLAYCSWYRVVDEAEIVNIAVSPGNRRCGLGRRLLRSVLQSAVKKGINQVFLEVRESNLAAVNLYASLGFRQTGRRRKYYPDTGEDALTMALALDPRAFATDIE